MRNGRKLKKVMSEMVGLAKKVYPRVEHTMYSGGHSGVDATIEFFAPAKYEGKLDKVLRERAWKALVDEDIFIAPLTRNIKHNQTEQP